LRDREGALRDGLVGELVPHGDGAEGDGSARLDRCEAPNDDLAKAAMEVFGAPVAGEEVRGVRVGGEGVVASVPGDGGVGSAVGQVVV
jgi:hypothetical protein